MYLPDSFSIGLATKSIENAENHFNNQDYLACAREIANVENHLLHRDNSLPGQRGINCVRACGLSEDDFHTFVSCLPPVTFTPLGDKYFMSQYNPQNDYQIDSKKVEFLMAFGKKLLLEVQELRG